VKEQAPDTRDRLSWHWEGDIDDRAAEACRDVVRNA
jgi:hypothetical protein